MRVSIDERLTRLCADFSVAKIGEWLQRKFASYDTSRADILSIAENKNDKEYFKSARLLGYVRELPERADGAAAGTTFREGLNRPLLVAAVEMRKILTERTSRQAQFNFAKRVLQNAVRGGAAGLNGYPSQGLFFFYDADGFFRISLVTGEMDGRKFKFNEAKRQSFYIDPNRPNHVAKSRLSVPLETFAALKEAFSVETLTKEFYGRLFAWYEWAMKPKTGVTFPNDDSTPDDDRKYNNESIIRLITRLMFTWFIRQRDMVKKELFNAESVKGLLKKFDPQSMDADNYYRAILQNLFFATFNCQPEKRGFIKHKGGSFACYSDQHNVKTLYRYEKEFKDSGVFKALLNETPFLNCALFDCLDKQEREQDGGRLLLFDGFSDNPKRQAHVPNGLFFNPEKGIIPLFDTYEFTIDENNADDADVALDPELLGKVFENLLGAFNPETQETARKATGSFYTPREIVDYMVEESLKNYLKSKLSGESCLASHVPTQNLDAWLDELFDKTAAAEKRELPFDDTVAAKMREALYSCKILDPACGSGAFPMGILHCMVRLFGRLDPSNIDLNKRLIMRYKQETNEPRDLAYTEQEWQGRQEQLKEQLAEGQHYPDYARKLYLIENCIYGVDIQPIATQISKLRFFISLLCDQLREVCDRDVAQHDSFLSLPNLEAKFVCANTLISLPKTEGEFELTTCSKIPELREKLQKNRHRIFAARTFKQKEKLKVRDLEIRDEIRDAVKATLAKPDKDLIEAEEKTIAQLRKDRIQYEQPKMVKHQQAVQGDLFAATQDELPFEMVDANKPKRDQIDAQIAFAQQKIDSERAKSSSANVTKIDQLATLVAGWDPYDQNATSPFFDPAWMFNLSSGFDVVIGNPPYVQLQANKGQLANLYKDAGFVTFFKMGDIYCLFYERGFHLSHKGSVVAYITPNTWLQSLKFDQFRRCVLNTASLFEVLSVSKVFDATVDTAVFAFAVGEQTDVCRVFQRNKNGEISYLHDVKLTAEHLNGAALNIVSDDAKAIVAERILSSSDSFSDWFDISSGVKPFQIGKGNPKQTKETVEKKPFVSEGKRPDQDWMPLMRGSLMGRYVNLWNNDYWIHYGKWLAEPRNPSYFNAPEKLIVRQTGDRIVAMLLEGGIVCRDNLYVCLPLSEIVNLRFALAIANSRLVDFVYTYLNPEKGEALAQVKRKHVAMLPYPQKIQDCDRNSVAALVDKILAAKKADPAADTSAWEREIDQLVYKLYGLTAEEIAVVEGREKKVEKVGGGGGEAGGVRGAPALPRRRVRPTAPKAVDDDEELE